jgi:hypothetical protein
VSQGIPDRSTNLIRGEGFLNHTACSEQEGHVQVVLISGGAASTSVWASALESGGRPDHGFRVHMEFVVRSVSFRAWRDPHLLCSDQSVLLDHRIVDVPAIHTPMPTGPHMPNCPVEIQEVLFHHQTVAT